jgi:hypothetical protein
MLALPPPQAIHTAITAMANEIFNNSFFIVFNSD